MPLEPMDLEHFAARRHAARARLGPREALLVFGNHHPKRNADTEYAYRQDSDLWYLTGWPDPEAALLLTPEGERLFVQPKDRAREIWTGLRPGPEGAKEGWGVQDSADIDQLPAALAEALAGVEVLHVRLGEDPERDRLVHGAIARARRPARERFLEVPHTFVHPSRLVGELRLHKTPAELGWLREAARVTAEAHVLAMAHAAPGRMEYELDALINHHFRRSGGNGPGYTTIVGGGANACILHYITNDAPLRDGELVLIDAGCELRNYTADVTRTFPVNGRFSGPQRAVYEVVLAAQRAAIAACRPGQTFTDVHDAAVRVLTEGMVSLGLLQGEVDALIAARAYKRYYMHGTSHWLGIDVHDVGAYVAGGASRALAKGMVLTVEPGLYVAPDDEDAPEALRGLGVRIEDDVAITAEGHEVLTAACPKDIDEVEAACRG